MLDMTVKLNSQIEIHLHAIVQIGTYHELVDGGISASVNEMVIKNHKDIALEMWPNIPIYTIDIEHCLKHISMPIPPVQCMAKFECFDPARNEEMMASTLIVIWFQDEMCPHLSPENEAKLKSIDWKSLAMDFDW